ncbi:MAG: hypothetical protein UV40_C0019G0014, partial [Parcubacteria group bacterium GW2011_GWA1_42_7]
FYEDKNIFGVVAQLAEHQKDFEKAIQFYEKAREYENAAKLAEKIGKNSEEFVRNNFDWRAIEKLRLFSLISAFISKGII